MAVVVEFPTFLKFFGVQLTNVICLSRWCSRRISIIQLALVQCLVLVRHP